LNTSEIYGIGVVGCGRAAVDLHLPALQKLSEARVVALADPDSAALHAAAERYDITGRTADVAGMLAMPGIDVVAVCVPAALHVATALPVLETGRHLLIEKPLALDRSGCERLMQAEAGHPGRVAVGFNLRYHRLVQAARDLIGSGQLGRIEAISSTWTSAIRRRQSLPEWRNSRASGGGALFEIAVHHFDLWRYLLGTEIEMIQAHSNGQEWPDETVSVSARLCSGAVANGLFSERSSDRNTLDIMGRDGRLSLDLFRYDGFEFASADEEPGVTARLRGALSKAAGLPRGVALMRQGGDFLLSYQHQWRDFLASIAGGNSLGASLHDGFAAVRTVLAAIESADSGTPVRP
jgi:predicted dehydrogenase